jgi:hypothetical protein
MAIKRSSERTLCEVWTEEKRALTIVDSGSSFRDLMFLSFLLHN